METKCIYNLHPFCLRHGSPVRVLEGRWTLQSIHVQILSQQASVVELECDFFSPLVSLFPHLGKWHRGSLCTVAMDAFCRQGFMKHLLSGRHCQEATRV